MRQIQLTQGKVALVDDADFERVSRWKWYATKHDRRFYAVRREGSGRVYLHRFILGTPEGVYTDHLNGDGLDNRRANLRACTNAENQRNRTRLNSNNTSGTLGVTHEGGRWRAFAMRDRKKINLGSFRTKEEAVSARNHFDKATTA